MATYNLRSFQDNAIADIEGLYGVIRLEGEWSMFCKQTRQLCDNFMTLAAASLLSDMKVDVFFQNLCRSAENWRRYLLSSAEHFKTPSPLIYNAPLYAAIVAGDQTILSGLLKAMPVQWQPGEEYEDQFHICWLHLLLAQNNCQLDTTVQAHLDAHEASADDTIALDLFKALLGIDDLQESDFWGYFENALLAREEYVQTKVEQFTTKVVQFIPHRYMWFEGLTWLRLAVKKGFVLPSRSILFCPDEALGDAPKPYAGDWLIVPLAESIGS